MAKSSKKYSKVEKRSWWNGVRYGQNGVKRKGHKTDKRSPKRGAYNTKGRVNENLVDDLNGPVVFWDSDIPF
ncbi:MAG: hypothetical protein IJ706_06580 [Clostridia bacterium]|nr:hypothetical protein [Clostridia bacterium]